MEIELATVLGVWAAATLRSVTPLLLTTLGETLTQRVGVINLGIEGEMLAGACVGFAVAAGTGNPLLGFVAGAAAGGTLSLVHAALVLGAHANQIASGLAVWMIGLGVTSYAGRGYVGQQVTPLPTLGSPATADWPLIGPFLQQTTMTGFAAIAIVLFAAWWLARTRTGLAWRTVGESARVAAENGLNPTRIRLYGIFVGGLLAGLAGAVLSVDYTQTWAQEMTKGRGLIAVGLVIVARWKPALVLPVCLLFGLTEVAVLRLQSTGSDVSSYLLASMPYVVVILVLIATHILARRASTMPADLRSVFA
jgi:ABC-type uncharacterized transport system permease subunit